MYVFADYRNPKVQVIAENLNAEQIKIDLGAGIDAAAILCFFM